MKPTRAERLRDRHERLAEKARSNAEQSKAAWKQKRKQSVKKKQAVAEKRKIAARKRRLLEKQSPRKYEARKQKERERWKRRRDEGKIKLINDMSRRDIKQIRKDRRDSAAKHRAKLKAAKVNNIDQQQTTNAAETNDPFESLFTPTVSQQKANKELGRKKKRKIKAKVYKENEKLQLENQNLKRKLWKIKKSVTRKKIMQELTPRSSVNKELEGKFIPANVRKKLVFGETLARGLGEWKSVKSEKTKQVLYKSLPIHYLKKYGLLKTVRGYVAHRFLKNNKIKRLSVTELTTEYERNPSQTMAAKRKQVENYFYRNEVSTMCPGKKQWVKVKGVKKRKRYLTGSLFDLYQGFKNDPSNMKISYALFCQYRPFWVVHPKLTERDTCLCTKCENMKLLVQCLNCSKVLKAKRTSELVSKLCCDEKIRTEQCLQRTCDKCKDISVTFQKCDTSIKVKRHKWIRIEEADDNNTVKTRTVKKVFDEKISDLQKELVESIPDYLSHLFRLKHQHKTIREIIENLSDGEMVVHFDWSENYICKYHREVQSAYYGASKETIVLHQGMIYSKNDKKGFLTISQSKRKDPSSICTHLAKPLRAYLDTHPGITKVHLCSDSPTSQYRNKDNFYAMTRVLPELFPQITEVVYHYTEAGHGKSSADGIGAAGKSILDNAVKHGADMPDFAAVISCLQERSKKIFIDSVTKEEIEETDKKMPEGINRFVGTMKVHQFTWKKENKEHIYFNTVSCSLCPPGEACKHFGLPGCPWNPYGPQPTMESDGDSCDEPEILSHGKKTRKGLHCDDWVAAVYNGHWYPGWWLFFKNTLNIAICHHLV